MSNRAVKARDAALRRASRIGRSMTVLSVVAAGGLTELAAHSFRGHSTKSESGTVATSGARSSAATATSGSSSSTSGSSSLQSHSAPTPSSPDSSAVVSGGS